MARQCLAVWLLLLVIIAAGEASEKKDKKKKNRAKSQSAAEDVPPRPNFVYATELDADGFAKDVTTVNESEAKWWRGAEYYPLVMFHMSWCKHCRHALPEFESAAKMVSDAQENIKQSGQRHQYPTPPRFFLVECDASPEQREICKEHAPAGYPVIKLFREKRSVRFNRPRLAQTFSWWAMQVSKPAVSKLAAKEHMQSGSRQGPFFIMNVNPAVDEHLLNIWAEVALDHIEDYPFVYVQPESEVAKGLPSAPSVIVKGPGLEPLPFQGKMTRETLAAWVSFNQFEPVTELTPYTSMNLKKSGVVVVTLVHDGKTGDEMQMQFSKKAQQLRLGGKYVFSTVNTSSSDNIPFLQHVFPLLAPGASTPPRVFAFAGEDAYWENPQLRSPGDITIESLEVLLNSTWALQDGSTSAWVKEKWKIIFRYATNSLVGFTIVLTVFLGIIGCCSCCFYILLSDDEESHATKVDKKD